MQPAVGASFKVANDANAIAAALSCNLFHFFEDAVCLRIGVKADADELCVVFQRFVHDDRKLVDPFLVSVIAADVEENRFFRIDLGELVIVQILDELLADE